MVSAPNQFCQLDVSFNIFLLLREGYGIGFPTDIVSFISIKISAKHLIRLDNVGFKEKFLQFS